MQDTSGSASDLARSAMWMWPGGPMLCHLHRHSPKEHWCPGRAARLRVAGQWPRSSARWGGRPWEELTLPFGRALPSRWKAPGSRHQHVVWSLQDVNLILLGEFFSCYNSKQSSKQSKHSVGICCGACGKGGPVGGGISETSSAWRRHMAFAFCSPVMETF